MISGCSSLTDEHSYHEWPPNMERYEVAPLRRIWHWNYTNTQLWPTRQQRPTRGQPWHKQAHICWHGNEVSNRHVQSTAVRNNWQVHTDNYASLPHTETYHKGVDFKVSIFLSFYRAGGGNWCGQSGYGRTKVWGQEKIMTISDAQTLKRASSKLTDAI